MVGTYGWVTYIYGETVLLPFSMLKIHSVLRISFEFTLLTEDQSPQKNISNGLRYSANASLPVLHLYLLVSWMVTETQSYRGWERKNDYETKEIYCTINEPLFKEEHGRWIAS